MLRQLLATILLATLLVGCDEQAMYDKLLPAEETAVAKEINAKLAERDFPFVESRLGSSLRTPDVRKKIEEVADLLPAEKPKSVRVVGSNTMSMNSKTTYNLSFEYEYPGKWLIVNTVLQRQDGRLTLEGIHITPIRQSLEATNSFSLASKGPVHLAVLALAVVIPIFVIYALVVCARTKMTKRKWLWLIFVALGVVQFHFNWSTGAWELRPFAVSLLGAGFAKMGPVAPWVFTLAFPLGAIVFLFKRRSIQRAHDASVRAPRSSPAPNVQQQD